MSRRFRIPKVVYKVVLSTFILFMVLIGGGVAYTWYVGQNSDEQALAEPVPVATQRSAPIRRVQQDPNAPVGVAIQAFTTPVAPGDNASMSIRTNPNAECTITVTYDKVESKDSGLIPKIADEYGMVSWAWTVEDTTPLGKWPAKVTCTRDDKSGVAQGDLVIAPAEDEE